MSASHSMPLIAESRLGRALWITAAVLSALLAIYSYRYLPRIGPMASDVVANVFARPWLDIHVAGSATALLCGPIQFLPRLRARHKRLHRAIGSVYVAGCVIGGAGGFMMAFGSTAGPIATVGFGSLAVTWITANLLALRLALRRRFAEHRAWMIRSFAMTFAAVVLRLFLPVAPLLGYPFIDGYRALSFLSWIPSLIIVEFYLRNSRAVATSRGSSPAMQRG